jgi:multidrug efflux pump subunit AcrA (membrane-fusion protein)
VAGVLQELPLQVGQSVATGTLLARVANPDRLKAELRIPETQAKDLAVGQPASIDTHTGADAVIKGKVARVDPAAQAGTVRVEVTFEGAPPRGARPDLTVEGTVELERLDDVLYVGRPSFAETGASVKLFRLSRAGDEASRVAVQLGRSSVRTIEIKSGLAEGDRIILSDLTQLDSVERIRLK